MGARPSDKYLGGNRVRAHGMIHAVLAGSEENWRGVNGADRCPIRSTLCRIRFRSACVRDDSQVTCLVCLVCLAQGGR